ncbi:MAG: HEAT repeat domain-containing protein [Myxococcaceae bacterium]
MTRTSLFATIAALGLSAAASPSWAAEPTVASVRAEISRARRSTPKPFAALATLKQRLPELDAKKRGRLAPVAPALKSLGPAGLLPILEELLAARPDRELTPSARLSWRVGLLEAAGAVRDARASPVLREVLGAESDPVVLRAAAGALGKLGDEAALATLLPLAGAPGPKQLAIVEGLGECRRLPAAETLAKLLAEHPAERLGRAAIKSLGVLASSWAWETPALKAQPERAAVQAVAARALVGAFTTVQGEARVAAEASLLQVDSPEAPELIAAAKEKAAPADIAELDRLADRLAHNPLRPQP